jgi:hypothetical protein
MGAGMTEQSWIELASRITNIGAPAMLLLIIVTGYYQKWVWGHQLVEMRNDRDFWRNAALKQTNVLEKAVVREDSK